ncbi:hypothetical protein BDV06DRAFT_159477 [Aspergillus oleicola]
MDFITSPYNHLGQHPGNCPLRILQIDDAEYHQPVAYGKHLGLCNITAGFYIHPVMQKWPLFWSNGCRLLLPFAYNSQDDFWHVLKKIVHLPANRGKWDNLSNTEKTTKRLMAQIAAVALQKSLSIFPVPGCQSL